MFRAATVLLCIAGCCLAGADSKPSREAAVGLPRDLLQALEAKDYDKALTFLQVPPGLKPEDVKKELPKFLELKEISKKGIDILAKEGKWGKLDEIFGDRAKKWAERGKVPLESCYGLGFKNAEAGFYWDGKQFKIIRCDDIGKLE
jgi:hypothetical protein